MLCAGLNLSRELLDIKERKRLQQVDCAPPAFHGCRPRSGARDAPLPPELAGRSLRSSAAHEAPEAPQAEVHQGHAQLGQSKGRHLEHVDARAGKADHVGGAQYTQS